MHAIAAIDGGVDARDRDFALVADDNVHDRGNVADKAAVRGDAEPLALRQLLAPARLLGGELGYSSQPTRLDRIALEGFAVVPPLGGDLLARVDGAVWPDQLQQEVFGVLAELVCDLGDEGLGRPGVHHVVDRPEPADTDVAL